MALLWKELKATTFDPQFGATVRLRPRLLSRLLLVAVAVTAVASFDAVGAILVVTLLIVPAATAYLLTDRLVVMVAITVAVGWIGAAAGYAIAHPHGQLDRRRDGPGLRAVLRPRAAPLTEARGAHPAPAPPPRRHRLTRKPGCPPGGHLLSFPSHRPATEEHTDEAGLHVPSRPRTGHEAT